MMTELGVMCGLEVWAADVALAVGEHLDAS